MTTTKPCAHEWAMARGWFGCIGEDAWMEWVCRRCGERVDRAFERESFVAGAQENLERVELELELRDSPACEPPG